MKEDDDQINTNTNQKENENNLLVLEDKISEKKAKDMIPLEIEDNKDIKDEKPHQYKKKNFTAFKNDPYLDSNIISRFFMYWAFKIINIATKTKMKKEYLGQIADAHDAKHFNNDISYIWDVKGYKNIKKYALILCVFRANIKMILLVFFLTLIKAATNYFSIIVIKVFIDHFDENAEKENFLYDLDLWVLGILFISSQAIGGILDVQNSMLQGIFGNKAQFQLSVFIYHKILKCSQSSFSQRATEGQIINFVQFDTGKFNWMLIRSPSLLLHPIQIVAYSYLVYAFFGKAFLPGILVILLFCVVGYFTSRFYHYFQFKMLRKKDIRMKSTTEIFENIKILKLYNWEKDFTKKILVNRKEEMDRMFFVLLIFILTWFVFTACPCILSCLTLGLYQRLNSSISIGTMLIGLSLFQRLQEPINQLPSILSDFVEATVSLTRIENYIKQPDIIESNIHSSEYDINSEYAIKIENGNFSWGVRQHEQKKDKKDGENNIKNKDEDNIEEEEDIMKSHRETNNRINELNVPLVQNSERQTFQDVKNEKENDQEIIKDGCKIQIPIPEGIHYDVTLKNINFMVKPGEVLGIIGEVGSGKSSLLQAILNCLILLNPKECDGIHIKGKIGYVSQIPWIQNETIKNNILFFKEYDQEKYDKVLEKCQLKYDLDVLEGGDLTEIGEKGVNLSGGQKVRISLARAVYSDPDIYLFDDPISALDANIGKKVMNDLIIEYLKNKTRIVVTHALQYLKYMDRIIYMRNGRIEWSGSYKELSNQEFFISMKKLSKLNESRKEKEKKERKNSGENQKTSQSGNEVVKIIKAEDEEIGAVKLGVYINYSRYMGGTFYLFAIFLIGLIMQTNSGGGDLWLAYWSSPENQDISRNDNESKWIFFYVYCGLSVSSVVFCLIYTSLLAFGHLRLSRYLHKDMIIRLVKAPINLFHDTIPRGQIYNRLTKDLDTCLFNYYSLKGTIDCLLRCISSFILCAYYDIYSLIYMPFVFVFGYMVTRFFLKGSRPLTRIEAISRSPILNTLSETLPGFASIKAFKVEENYLKKYYKRVNDCFNINICIRGTNMWLQEMFKFFSIIYLVYLVTRTCINEENQTSQSVGIMFTYSVILQDNLGWCFACFAFTENNMICMERCKKYTEIKGEKPSIIRPKDEQLKKENWPQEGKIRFENYSVRYRPNTEIVLKNLNFSVNAGEKVGIVGRTGSGKSTICLCLFRILEPYEGTIYIDGEDITKIGLDILRKNLTIIPQDPCLMEGTLKYNIDPFNKVDNEEIIHVLKKIGFEYTESDDIILDRKIEQSGTNLSVGEKQLICICRAILRKTKIIVMDEATANIDMTTEEKIQKALEYALNDSTVITVAHRIKTIINYDKILVLNNGEIVEFDSPSNLIKNEKSLFYQLYSKSTV
jgi:ABC-type multidrug transport system fused ATPase/permease subunit